MLLARRARLLIAAPKRVGSATVALTAKTCQVDRVLSILIAHLAHVFLQNRMETEPYYSPHAIKLATSR